MEQTKVEPAVVPQPATEFTSRQFEITDNKDFQAAVIAFRARNEVCKKVIEGVRDELGAEYAVERNGLVYGFTYKDDVMPEDKRTMFKQRTERLQGRTVYDLGRVHRLAKKLSTKLDEHRYGDPEDLLEAVNLKGWMMFFQGRVRSVGLWTIKNRTVVSVPETNSTVVNTSQCSSSENEKYEPVENVVQIKASEFCAIFEADGKTPPARY